MTEFSMLVPELKYAFSGVLFVAVLSELALVMYKHSRDGSLSMCFKNIFLLMPLLILLSFLTAASDNRYYVNIPWNVITFVCLIVFTHSATGFRQEYIKSKQNLSASSIKQALDNLNSGICFVDRNGKIVLINHKMRKLVCLLCGRYPQMYGEIRSALEKGAKRVDKTDNIYHFKDGKIWHLHIVELAEDGLEGYKQITAQDVTEIYEANIKLDQANAELQKTNIRLKEMYERLADRIREQETLNLKVRIHDNIGSSLIAISDILNGNTKDDMAEQITALKNAVNYFSGDSIELPKTIDELQRKAKKLKVELEISGKLPKNTELEKLIGSAVSECITNCVRHAKGSKVFVEISEKNGVLTVTVTNNGEAPKSEIKECGGLSALRKSIESADGEMYISASPNFKLTLILHRKEQKNDKYSNC